MPDRTNKELLQIKNEVKLILGVYERHEGKRIIYNPFDNKTNREDSITLTEGMTRDLKTLKKSKNSILSCEGNKLLDIMIHDAENPSIIGFFSVSIHQSSAYKPVEKLSLDEIYQELKTNPTGRKINNELDKILGNGCYLQACNKELLKEAKSLAFNPENVTISNPKIENIKTKILTI